MVKSVEEVDRLSFNEAQQTLESTLLDCLPDLSEDKLVDMLEFIAVQHTGSPFSADNIAQAEAISEFVTNRPFAVTKTGVARCDCVARATQLQRLARSYPKDQAPCDIFAHACLFDEAPRSRSSYLVACTVQLGSTCTLCFAQERRAGAWASTRHHFVIVLRFSQLADISSRACKYPSCHLLVVYLQHWLPHSIASPEYEPMTQV